MTNTCLQAAANEVADSLTTMLDLESDVPAAECKRNRTYLAGSTMLRESDVHERFVVANDGQQPADGPRVMATDSDPLTLEAGLFPFLFCEGHGWCTDSMTMAAYLKMRMQSLFSVFTLFLPYLLVMFQVCDFGRMCCHACIALISCTMQIMMIIAVTESVRDSVLTTAALYIPWPCLLAANTCPACPLPSSTFKRASAARPSTHTQVGPVALVSALPPIATSTHPSHALRLFFHVIVSHRTLFHP